MQQIYIPSERVKLLKKDPAILASVSKAFNCRIKALDDDLIEIEGEAFSEFTAKNVIYAFGRGFDIKIALKLSNPDFYFKLIDLGAIMHNAKRVRQMKARIIGEEGRTRRYIEEVSTANISIYGDTIGLIGNIEQISEAETAVSELIEGGTHKKAYLKMEAMHRKNKAALLSAKF